MLWIPLGALVVTVCALACIGTACVLARQQRWGIAITLVAVAALLFRVYAANYPVLHPFDERYHALVAKHLIDRPFVPTLYADPVLPYDATDWHTNHVWLHKPPLPMWLQAVSMAAFGIAELPMRLPSIILSSLAVALTFGIGRMLFTPQIGLAAAIFHALNGFLVDLASGRRASDHIDTTLIVIIEATLLAALIVERRGRRWLPLLLGIGTGLAWLSKSVSGLLVIPIWFLMRLPSGSALALARVCALAGVISLAVILPWAIYTWRAFPIEAQHESAYALRHVSEVLEGQGGPLWSYLSEMPKHFGETIFVPLLIAFASVIAGTASPARKGMLLWMALPYVLYSPMATKMPGYVMIAAPALFLIQGEVWLHLWRRLAESVAGRRRLLIGVALFVLGVLPARHLLNPTGPMEVKDDAEWADDLRELNWRIRADKAVIFNVPTPIEAMFYTPFVAYPFEATREQVASLQERGYRVFRYEPRTAGNPARIAQLAE